MKDILKWDRRLCFYIEVENDSRLLMTKLENISLIKVMESLLYVYGNRYRVRIRKSLVRMFKWEHVSCSYKKVSC